MKMAEKLKFIFVHGLSGWGSYDKAYERMPYWGMRGGDVMAFLRSHGFDCYAASVAPAGSAWDRACELYAQLAGCRVDYGKAHSERFRHDRFGRDFTGCPLIEKWDGSTRIVLLGHSFGGATIRLFSELLANGDMEEREACPDDISPFFVGGMSGRIHSIVAISSPMNGTTAYDMYDDPSFKPEDVKVPWWTNLFAKLMSAKLKSEDDEKDSTDSAGFDMHIDNAMAMNNRISTLLGVYYFSIPCSFTRKCPDGLHRPKKRMEQLFNRQSYRIGAYKGKTKGGVAIDESWRENDGLVNTISAVAPFGAPSKPLDRADIRPGIWNVFPKLDGDHMWPQGGLMRKHDTRGFYLDLVSLITSI